MTSNGTLSLFQNNSTDLNEIVELFQNKKVEILCGAGMSRASGCALANDISIKIMKSFGNFSEKDVKILLSKYPFEVIASAFIRKKSDNKLPLRELIKESLDECKGNIHSGHIALQFLNSQGYIGKIYTTNFDLLLEDTFKGKSRMINDSTVMDIEKALEDGDVPILHIHGTIENNDFLISEKETINLNTPLAEILKGDMVTKNFVLVGYSMNDPDLRTIYLFLKEMLMKHKVFQQGYIVYPLDTDKNTQPFEIEFVRRIWEERGMTYIPMNAEDFFTTIVEKLKMANSRDLIISILNKRSIDSRNESNIENVWKEAKEMANKMNTSNPHESIIAIAVSLGIKVN